MNTQPGIRYKSNPTHRVWILIRQNLLIFPFQTKNLLMSMSCPMSTYKAYNQGRSSKCPTYNYSSQFTIYALLFCILILTKNLIKLVEIATFCKNEFL